MKEHNMTKIEIKKALKLKFPDAETIKWNKEFKWWEVTEDSVSEYGFESELTTSFKVVGEKLVCIGSIECEV